MRVDDVASTIQQSLERGASHAESRAVCRGAAGSDAGAGHSSTFQLNLSRFCH